MRIFLVHLMINILFLSGVYASNASTMNNAQSIKILANALTKIKKPKTLKVAKNKKNVDLNSLTFDLITR